MALVAILLAAALLHPASEPIDGPLLDLAVTAPPGIPREIVRERADPVDVLRVWVEYKEGVIRLHLQNIVDKRSRHRRPPP